MQTRKLNGEKIVAKIQGLSFGSDFNNIYSNRKDDQ